MSTPIAFDVGCGPVLVLTIRTGPGYGRTIVDCTCGWSKIYKTRKKAFNRVAEHEAMQQKAAS